MNTGLGYVKERYGVPVRRGMRVTYEDRPGVVTCGDGGHVRVRLDGQKRSGRYHPLDLDYGDGIAPEDRLAWHNGRIDTWNDRLNQRITADEYRARMSVPLSEHLAPPAGQPEPARSETEEKT